MLDYGYIIKFYKKTDYFFIEKIKDYLNTINSDIKIIKIKYNMITTQIYFDNNSVINVMLNNNKYHIWVNTVNFDTTEELKKGLPILNKIIDIINNLFKLKEINKVNSFKLEKIEKVNLNKK